MKQYQVRKTSPVARNNFKEIIWEGPSTAEAVQKFIDKKNYQAMKNNRLDYYDAIELES